MGRKRDEGWRPGEKKGRMVQQMNDRKKRRTNGHLPANFRSGCIGNSTFLKYLHIHFEKKCTNV